MSGPALASDPIPEHIRAVAAAEVAARLGRVSLARELATRALSADPCCMRALALIGGREAVEQRPHVAGSHRHVIDEAVLAIALPEATTAEAAAVVAGIVEYGSARVRPSRRHRGDPMPARCRLVVHHALPDLAIVVENGRAIGIRTRGRTVRPPRAR